MNRKRSITIRGHRTSFSIEDEFWMVLKQCAADANQSLAQLITRIDTNRKSETNLSSALRLHVLKSLTDQLHRSR